MVEYKFNRTFFLSSMRTFEKTELFISSLIKTLVFIYILLYLHRNV